MMLIYNILIIVNKTKLLLKMTLQLQISKNVLKQHQTKAGKITTATDQKGKNYFTKLINIEQAQELGYNQCIEFNKQIFGDIQQFAFKEHLLQIKTDLNNGQMFGLVTQPYETNIEKYLKTKKITQKQAKDIFSQVVKAIYSIIMNGYWHRNVRAEHFVKVKNVWKLQSLVLNEDYSQCNGNYNQYLWNPKYQPPEFNPNNKNYTDDQYNLMTVWNLGCILLQLLTINHKLSTKEIMDKFKGKEFTMEAIGISPAIANNYSPQIRSLLGKMLHHNPTKRMTLSELFENPQISPQVSKLALQKKKIPPSKIVTGKSSIKSSKLGFKSQLALNEIAKSRQEQQKQHMKRLYDSKIGLDDDPDQLGITLRQISTMIPKKNEILIRPNVINGHQENYVGNADDLLNSKNHPIRKALQIYKSYYDQSQLLMLSAEQIIKLDFKMLKNESEIKEIKFLNKYAIFFVSLVNLNALAEGFNQNKNILDLNGDLFINFQNSQQYSGFQKLVNFKKNQRLKLLQQIKKQFFMAKNKNLIEKDQKIIDLLGKDYKKTNFQDIKLAYRFIVKFAYDAISQQYNRMKSTDSAASLAKIAMYVTYALTIDKLYIMEDIPDNFKYYFEWLKKPACSYVPLGEFKRYIQQAPKDILIENSRYILKKYYNL